jgi:hypothetical protein
MKFVRVLILCALLIGCSKNATDIELNYTNRMVGKGDFMSQYPYNIYRDKYSSARYEIVDYDWLTTTYYDYFSSELFKENVTKWDDRSNCVLFCQYYVVKANLLYYRASFHSGKTSSRLALGMIWYTPDANNPLIGHSIVVALTNKGWIHIDPQLPKGRNIINLTEEQIKTISLREI